MTATGRRLSAPAAALACAVSLLSGASCLLYEIVWARQLTPVVGSTTSGVATVTTAFMLGLLGGSLLAGTRVARVRAPLRVLGMLELAVAAWASLFPYLLEAAAGVLASGSWGLRLAGSVGLVLVPTTLMGATLPLLVRQLVPRLEGADRGLALLYTLNTVGASAGCAVAPDLCMGFGLQVTTGIAQALSLLVAVLALLLSSPVGAWEEDAEVPAPLPLGALLAVVAVSGLCSTALEMTWIRLLRLYTPPPDLIVNSRVLTVYLAGLAAGSAVHALGPPSWRTLAALPRALALASLAGIAPCVALYLGGADLDRAIRLAYAAIFVGSGAFGYLFPLFGGLATTRLQVLGARVGAISAVLFGANAAGTMAACFLVLPALGLKWTLTACALTIAATGLVISLAHPGLRAARWPLLVTALGVLLAATSVPALPFVPLSPGERVVFYRDGLFTSTVVVETPERPPTICYSILTNRTHGSPMAMHIPLLLHPHPRRMLIIGFCTGSSSGQALQACPSLALTTVELDENQATTARYFEPFNFGVVDDPRFRFVHDDGMSFMREVQPGAFDIIAVDANLYDCMDIYSLEFTRLVKSKLAPDGLFCQKLALSENVTADHVRRILGTFQAVFPQATLWHAGPHLDLMVGGDAPFSVDPAVLRERALAAGIQAVPPDGPRLSASADAPLPQDALLLDTLGRFRAGPREIKAYHRHAPLILLDRPFLDPGPVQRPLALPRGDVLDYLTDPATPDRALWKVRLERLRNAP